MRGAQDEPPVSRAPVPTAHPAFGVGEGVWLAHGDRHKVLAHLGHPGAWAWACNPTRHVSLGLTGGSGHPWEGRAGVSGGTAGLVAEGGRRRTRGGARSRRGARNPVSSEGRGFPGACELFTVPPWTTGQPLCRVLRAGQERRGGNMVEPQLPGWGASCGINRGAGGGPRKRWGLVCEMLVAAR